MVDDSKFDSEPAHKHFSAFCFNSAWGLMDKTERTAEEDQQMLNLCHASLWHWTQREDCTDENLSIGYWQISRAYALVGQPDNARRYGQMCLNAARESGPFLQGYAYEALARAEAVAGNQDSSLKLLKEARLCADAIESPEEKKMLLGDLKTIGDSGPAGQ
jgi:hypothetical protein